jgi:hypothetical protein
MLPEELRPAPGEGVYSWLVIPQAGKVPLGATVGEDVEEAQELRMNPARGVWSLFYADSGLAQREAELKGHSAVKNYPPPSVTVSGTVWLRVISPRSSCPSPTRRKR